MESTSRRTFLRQAGTGAAAVGAWSVMPAVSSLHDGRHGAVAHTSALAKPPGNAHDGPLLVHIPEPNSGRVHFLFGTTELVRHDPALVARLLHAAR